MIAGSHKNASPFLEKDRKKVRVLALHTELAGMASHQGFSGIQTRHREELQAHHSPKTSHARQIALTRI